MATRQSSGPTKTPQQNPRRRRGFERAVTLVGPELKTPAEKRGFAETKLLTHWPEIVGPDIAEMAVPVKVKFGRGFGGTLVLLTTGAKAPLLEMSREAIITRVNACYGYSAIKDVQVTQTAPTGFAEGQVAFTAAKPKAKATPDPARLEKATQGLDQIDDPVLRDALRKLAGNIVMQSNR
ncbi:RNA-binding protein [Jannaschia sp. EhC01]|nr:RNA-binding protein [Jannaschia sp. EhC01]